jgi:hypothetical protein
MNKTYILTALFVAALGWAGCRQAAYEKEDGSSEVESTSIDENMMTDLPDSVSGIAADEYAEGQSPQGVQVHFDDMTVAFHNLVLETTPKTAADSTPSDTFDIVLGLGQAYEDLEFSVNAPDWTNVTVEQQYETSLALYDPNGENHLALRKWKHYHGPWQKITPLENGHYKTLYYDEQETTKFPKFTRKEVAEQVQRTDPQPTWKKMLAQPSKGEMPWGVGISEVRLRIKGEDGNGLHERIIRFIIPMG